MKQIDGFLSWTEASEYIRKVKRFLRSFLTLEQYISDMLKTKADIHQMAEEKGKKAVLMKYDGTDYPDYDVAYDKYMERLEASLYRAEHLYTRMRDGLNRIRKDSIREVIRFCYIEGGTIEDAEEKLCYSGSSISRYKKIGLARIAEAMFGILIDV